VEDLPPGPPPVVACDVSGIVQPDEVILERLARLQLAARRLGATIRFYNACPALMDLIALAGMADVLEAVPSGVEMDGEVEQREQLWIDEEVLRGDGIAGDGEDVE
jgi:hypothetical protein